MSILIDTTVEIDIEDYIDEFTDLELIEELESREYTVTKGGFFLEKEHIQFLLDNVDRMPQDWFVRQIRDSLVSSLEKK
jgi:hypothetical protein